MRAAALAIAGLAIGAGTGVAAASPCGGGGGSSGGSSSGGSSSSGGGGSSDSDSSSSSRPACVEESDIVGYRKCTGYGVWATSMRIPRLIFHMGMATRQAPSLIGGRTGHVEHDGEEFAYRTLTPPAAGGAGFDQELTFTMRTGIGLPHGLFVAADFEVGGLVSPAAASAEMMTSGARGMPSIDQRNGMVINATGVAGYQRPTSIGNFGVELAGGVRSVSYAFDSAYGACEQTTTIRASAPILEARARAEHWLNPWVALGAAVGTSLVDRGAWMGSLYLGVQTRAFGGGR